MTETALKEPIFTQTNLIAQIKQTFTTFPDARSGNGVYQKYDISDAALSAFSTFFMQSPSFLDYRGPHSQDKIHITLSCAFCLTRSCTALPRCFVYP